MPRVPTIDEQATLNPLRGELRAHASADAFGAGVGRGLQQGGHQVGEFGRITADIAVDMQQRHNEAVVKEAYTRLSESVRDVLRNPDSGYFSQRGRNALAAQESAAEAIREAQRKAREGLRPAQVLLFERVARAKVDSSLDLIANHARSEFANWENQSTEAQISNLIEDAQNNAGDHEAVAGLTASIEHEFIETAKRNGWHEDLLEAKLRDAYTRVHGGIVAQQIDAGDVTAAKAWLGEYGHLIAPASRGKLEKALDGADLRQQSQAAADQIVAGFGAYKEQLAAARRIQDARVRDETVKRINARRSETDIIHRERQKELTKQAWTTAMETGSSDSIPATVWSQLEPSTQRQIESYLEKDGDVQTDWVAYHELTDMMGRDPRAFAEVELLDYRNRLADSEFKWLTAQQVAFRQGRETEIKDAATLQQQLRAVHNTMKWSGEKYAEKRGRFDQAAYDAVHVEEKRLGRKLGFEERKKIIDRLLVEGHVPSLWNAFARENVPSWSVRWRSGDRHLFEVLETDEEAHFVPDEVPAPERDKIAEALQRNGMDVTEERILDLYTKKMLRESR